MAKAPQDNDRPAKAWPMALRIVAPLLLVPILYVLSPGPPLWLYQSGWLSKPWDEILRDAYYPITLAEQRLPALAAYLEWWKPARPSMKPQPPIPRHKFGTAGKMQQSDEAKADDQTASPLP